MELRFDNQVAIVTGAGRGLGRAYARLLAARGAAVVVNDPGVGLEGEGGDDAPARSVVADIIAAGGRAVANLDPVGTQAVADGMIAQAIDAFGRIDILINNAGNFMPVRRFMETSQDSFDNVYSVHVRGSEQMIRAAWPHMSKQRYGKIINIVSSVGYIGTPGRLEYGVAKAALHGLTRCLSYESLADGIHINAISPGALTRPVLASTDNFDEAAAAAFSPDLVAPTALWLAHPDCRVNGEAFTVMAGTTARIRIGETGGFGMDAPTPEAIRDHFDEIMGQPDGDATFWFPADGEAQGMALVSRFGNR